MSAAETPRAHAAHPLPMDAAAQPAQPAREGPDGGRPDRREVAPALARAPHGIEVLDHGLALSKTTRVDLVGVDGAGRLVLVLLVAGAAADAHAALEALAFVRRRGQQLAEHLGRPLARASETARVMLIAGAATRALCDLVAPLAVAGIELCEVCELESHRGTRTFVGPVSGRATSVAAAAGRPGDQARDEAGDEPGRSARDELLEDLVRRIERIDERIEVERSAKTLRWRLDGRELCSLSFGGALPGGRVGGDEQRIELDDGAVAEAFLERVMERFLELAEEPPAGEPYAGARRTLGTGQLLTPEEIEAFREPL